MSTRKQKELHDLLHANRGPVVGWDWKQLVEAFGIPTDEAPDPNRAFYGQAGSGFNPYYQPQAQNAYWRAQLTPGPVASYQSARLSASRALQAALRQRQAQSIAAMQQAAQAQGLPPITLAPPPAFPNLTPPSYAPPPPPMPTTTAPDTIPDASAAPPFDPLDPYATDNSQQGSTTTMGVFDILGALARNAIGKPTLGPARKPGPNDPHSGLVIRASKGGRTFSSVAVNRNAKFNPKKTLQTARAVAAHAQQVGARAITALNKSAASTKVKGAAPGRRPPKMGAAAIKKLANKVITSGKKLSGTADKYAGQIAAFNNKLAAGQKKAQAATKVHGSVDVLGFSGNFHEIVGDQFGEAFFQEIVGDYIDPTTGVLMPGNDPNANQYGNADGSTDGSTGTSDGSTGGALSSSVPGPDTNYGAGDPPTPDSIAPQPYIDYVPDPGPMTDTNFYDCPTDDDLPLGAVVFDGSHQPSYLTLGNMSCFLGTVPGLPAPWGGSYSGYQYHGDDGWWQLLTADGNTGGYGGGKNYDRTSLPSAAMVAESQKRNYGPIMGAPTYPGSSTPSWTAGLRFSPSGPSGPRFFWYWDMAPDWAKQNILLARMNAAIVAYQSAVTAGESDYLAAQLQDQLDAADAAKAAKAQAAVDASVAQAQEVQQQQQAQFDEAQYEQQAQQDAALQAAQNQYLAQHPELMFQPAYDPNAQYAPPGYGGGDGSDLPPELQNGDGSFDTPNLTDDQIDWGDSGGDGELS